MARKDYGFESLLSGTQISLLIESCVQFFVNVNINFRSRPCLLSTCYQSIRRKNKIFWKKESERGWLCWGGKSSLSSTKNVKMCPTEGGWHYPFLHHQFQKILLVKTSLVWQMPHSLCMADDDGLQKIFFAPRTSHKLSFKSCVNLVKSLPPRIVVCLLL